jgi:hypothetical protein
MPKTLLFPPLHLPLEDLGRQRIRRPLPLFTWYRLSQSLHVCRVWLLVRHHRKAEADTQRGVD